MVYYFYRPQRSWGKVIFSEACVNNSVWGGMHGCSGGCMVARGGAWLLGGVHGCSGGMHGFIRGACMVLFGGACMVLFGGACVVLFGGHVWFYLGEHAWFYSGGMHGFIQQGGMHGFIQQGACMVLFSGGGHVWFFQFFGYSEVQSMSGRYASYWNAFLFKIYCVFCHFSK